MSRALSIFLFLVILIPGTALSTHPLAGTESLGERAEIVTLSTKQGQITADMFDFEDGVSSLLGSMSLPQGDLTGMQQLDAVCANLYSDHRDDIVIAYSKHLDGELGSRLVLVVPAITDGILDWNPDLTTTLEVPDFLLQTPETVQGPVRPVSPGYLRVISGNFVAEEPGQPTRQEILVCGWVLPEFRNASFKARIYSIDDDRNLHEVSTELLDYDAWSFRCPFDITTGDFDGDELDELVLVRRYKDTSGSDTAYTLLRVYRREDGSWVNKSETFIDSWTRGNLGNGVYVNDVDHLAATTGRFRASSTQPLIAIAAGHRTWTSTGYPNYPTLRIFPKLFLYRVDGATTETWALTESDAITNLPFTTIYPDSYVAISPSLGISNGDLNFDGRDEIVLAGPDKLRVFEVNQDINQNLLLNLLTEEQRPTTWDDASRRTVQVVDLDASAGNFVPEIITQEWMVNNPKMDLTPGLTAYWSFDHDFQADAGGSAFDAVAHNSPQIEDSGRFGSSVRLLRNSAQRLEVNAPVVTSGQDHTYSVWCRATWSPSQEDVSWYLLQSYPNYTLSAFCRNYDGDGYSARGVVQSQWDGGNFSYRFDHSSFVDRWHNFLVTYDAEQAQHQVYLDGELVGAPNSSAVLSEISGLIIGGNRDQVNTWDGWIDDVAVWDRVLTSGEIAAVQKQPVIPVDREYQVVVMQPELEPIQTDPDTLWAVTGLQGLDSWQGTAEVGNDYAVVVGDFDGDGYRIGSYTYHQGVVATTPTVVLKAPPIHFDVLDGTVYDLAGCYPEDCEFVARYIQESSEAQTTETTARTTFGLGASLTVGGGWDWLGAKAEATVKTTYGEHFENSSWGESSVRVSQEITTWNQDRIHVAVVTYDVYEYQVLGEGSVVGHVAVVVPSPEETGWKTTDGWLNLFTGAQSPSYALDHEPGNIMSYPSDLGLDAVNDQLNQGSYDVDTDGSGEYSVEYSMIAGSSAGTTREFGIEMGSSVSGGGVELELDASYSSSQMNVFKSVVSDELRIEVNFGHVNNPNATYTLRPMLYWSGGTLVVDYEVDPLTNLGQTSWWDLNYRDPDPAFILTHRYDEERYPAGGDPGQQKYITPDITMQPPFATWGDSVRVSAKVRNFSLEDLDQSLEVDFFLGDPDSVWGDGVLIGSAMVPPIAQRGMQEVAIDWQVPPGTPDVAFIWARINTDGLTEVHTNNNKGWGLMQSGGMSAVYDPMDLPTPLQITCSPNPFNPTTNFDFWVPRNGRTTLCVYDVTGRLVARLVDEYLPEGNHRRTWNGRDDSGQQMASGVYLYRIESGPLANTGKMVMLK